MKLKETLYCLLLTVLHFAYTLSFPSIINGERFIGTSYKWLEPSYIHAFFISRLKFGEFARRPITTWLIQGLESLGIPLEYAFIIVLYSALFTSFLLLFQLSKKLTSQSKYAYASVLIFASTFWVIHAVFAEIYAYDEPVQYAFVFAALIYLAKKAWFRFSVFFFFAMMVRESTVLLLPGIFFFFMLEKPLFGIANIIRTLKVAWTIPAYGVFLWLLIQGKELTEKSSSYMRDIRFKHLYYSFADIDIGIDTLTSFIMAFAVPLVLIWLYRSKYRLGNGSPWVWAMVLNAGFNTLITFTLTMGRETRIFAQPVLMVSPFLGLYFLKWIEHLKSNESKEKSAFQDWIKIGTIILFFISLCFGISLFTYEVYWPTDTKFFSGFQHHVYLTLTTLSGLIIINSLYKNEKLKLNNLALLLGFGISIALFFGNQKGYRAYDLFDPVAEFIAQKDSITGRDHYLLVGTNIPNIAENYFNSKEVDALAGDFNFQLPVKQFYYREEAFKTSNIIFLELEPAINFPFRYMLSQYGRTETSSIEGNPAFIVRTNEPQEIEPNSFIMLNKAEGFLSKTKNKEGQSFILAEEYSPAFKVKLDDVGIDTIYSLAAKLDFKADMESEAAIVVTIKSAESEVWEHEFLSIFLINPGEWNTAYKAIELNQLSDPTTEIAFYVWNKKMEKVEIKNMEIVFNSKFVSTKKGRGNVLSSRKLQ